MTIEKHEKIQFVDYFGLFGGFLGLWTGASLMSFMHVFVFVAQFVFPCLDPAVKQVAVSPQNEQDRLD